ncbi:TRAP transporter large permease subunit [Caballeronia sp. 15711]|uniref:TRAP transporter large permease n=1 Tax=Caballeronia sp. 15711 TaxID=3391029 RepID=UPI0039E467EB
MDYANSASPDISSGVIVRPCAADRLARAVAKRLIEPLCVFILVILFGLMLSSAFCRYALHSPLTWVDEVAGTLFLWLAMFGAALASQRNEHMRLSAFVERASPRMQDFVGTLGRVLTAFLLATLLPAAIAYVHSEWGVMSPTLSLPDGLRVAGIAIGLVFLIFFTLTHLWAHAKVVDILTSALIVAAVVLLALQGGLLFGMLGKYNLILFLVIGVGACVAMGVPIGYAFGIGAVAFVVFTTRFTTGVVVGRIDEGMSQLVLLSIPLFIMLGVFMELSGVASAIVRFLSSMLGHVKGGLDYVLIGAMFLVSGISGSKAADMAAVAPSLFPEMKKRGASEGELVALLAATGAQTETIPPSFVLIVLGSVTGVSIGALFTGGIVPAIVAGFVLACVVAYKVRKTNAQLLRYGGAAMVRSAFVYAFPALILPVLIRSFVVEGIMTATEVATIGIVYCAITGLLIYRVRDWNRLYVRLTDTASLSGAILLILGMATAVSWVLAQSGFSRDLARVMLAVPGGRYGFLAVSILVFVLLGSMLEGIPAIVLLGPLLFPIAKNFGIHEVQYAMVAILSMGLGLFAPPFGIGFYAACAIGGRVAPDEVVKHIWPYLLALLCVVVAVAAIPWLSIGFL